MKQNIMAKYIEHSMLSLMSMLLLTNVVCRCCFLIININPKQYEKLLFHDFK